MGGPGSVNGPYGAAANGLFAAGWRGILLLPPNQKAPPPTGQTGAGGTWPSGADVWATAEEHPEGNVGIRLPPTVLGLDVDNYAGKAGGHTWVTAQQRHGELPPTWYTTSRADGLSGIRLYKVTPGMHWPGEIGPGVDLIQVRHRYIVAPPSVHPGGGVYRWCHDDGRAHVEMPAPDQLPPLPDGWVAALTGGRLAVDTVKVQPDDADSVGWYTSEQNNRQPCGRVRTAAARAVAGLRTAGGSRHDAGLRAVMSLAYLASEGHTGVMHALVDVHDAWFTATTTGSSARDHDGAQREWQRIMSGALAVLSADGELTGNGLNDPCATPLAGLLEPQHDGASDRLERQETPPAPDAKRDPDDAATVFAFEVERAIWKMRVTAEARTQLAGEEAAKSWRPPPGLGSLTDELALPDEPVTYLVDEIMPVGANVVLTAQFKAGKTTLTNDLVRCLVDGVPFLGRYPTHLADGRVALWNYEVSAGQYRRWLRDVSVVNPQRVSLLNLRGYTMPLKVSHVQDWVVSWLIEHKIRVWVVDPLARAFLGSGQSENDNSEMGAFLETLDVIKERAGVSELIMPAHTGRATQEAGAERSRGATRVDDWADVRWLLTKDNDGNRFFRASGRDVETPEGTLMYDHLMRSLTLEDGGRDGIGNDNEPMPGYAGAVCNAILEAVVTNPGINLRGVRLYVRNQGLKSPNEKIDNALNALIQQGRIRRQTAPPGMPFEHYAVVQEGP